MSTTVSALSTATLLQEFLTDSEAKGTSKSTRDTYRSRLRHFAEEFPELPTTAAAIDKFLRSRGETPKKRGAIHRNLQIFYAFVSRTYGIPTPVAPKGPTGRPSKAAPVRTTSEPINAAQQPLPELDSSPRVVKSVQGGGRTSEIHIYIHIV